MKLLRTLALLLTAALLAAACGSTSSTKVAISGDDSSGETAAAVDTEEPPETTAPVTTGVPAETVAPTTTEAAAPDESEDTVPQRIVSISPTATEILFAIGAGEQVVAVDSFSNYPEHAPITDLSAFEPNIEAILGFEPDLVVTSFDPGDLGEGLAAAGVQMIMAPSASVIADSYSQIEQLGAATGHIAEAVELVAQMQADIAELSAQASGTGSYYHELDDTLFTVTSSTFIGEVYALAGLTNSADAADPDGEAFGFPQLSAEFLIETDPDLIFLADAKCCGQSAETVGERPGWSVMAAVQAGRIFELDDDIASRWGPRIVDFLAVIVKATATIPA